MITKYVIKNEMKLDSYLLKNFSQVHMHQNITLFLNVCKMISFFKHTKYNKKIKPFKFVKNLSRIEKLKKKKKSNDNTIYDFPSTLGW